MENKKVFEIRENRGEFSYNAKNLISEGCTLIKIKQEPDVREMFDSLKEARDALKKYAGSVSYYNGNCGNSFYMVEEYYIEENEYDNNGEFIKHCCVWDFAENEDLKNFKKEELIERINKEIEKEMKTRGAMGDKDVSIFINLNDLDDLENKIIDDVLEYYGTRVMCEFDQNEFGQQGLYISTSEVDLWGEPHVEDLFDDLEI